jgi:hypothetical protein
LIPGFLLCGFLLQFHHSQIETIRTQFTAEEMEAAKESIALSLMGQLQFTAHSLIWMKTLEYLHYGVALRMPTPAEERRGFRAREATDVSSGLAHQCGVPVALDDAMDWRGPVGQLHRTIVPHMQIHRHSDPVELIPWYQLTLKLNPNLERLYTLGAFFIADFAGAPSDALDLLETGVKANPWTFEIRAALGRLLFDYHQRLGMAPVESYERAARILREAIVYSKEEKKRIEMAKGLFDAYQDQLLQESYLFLAKSLVELDRYSEALSVCEEGYAITKHNHLIVQKRIIEKRMDEEKMRHRLN